jgi:AhpD family alkylhydroperoxidase
MSDRLKTFNEYRQRMNEVILGEGNLQINRFFSLDSQAYRGGALPAKTKELMGLVASMVLRCDDCITYHLIQCVQHETTNQEFFEAFNVALVVGGSIVIPHLRRAVDTLEEIRAEASPSRRK